METGANDVMVVVMRGEQRLLVPMIEDAVAEIDVENGVLLRPLDEWAPEDTELP
jgi:ribosomal 30S subunit maturation factor RimM